ncbi:NAC domain-containing protein like [Capsicum galapagoense]
MKISEISSNSTNPVMALGIRFHPTDEELIRYLLKFVSCKSYSCDNIRLEDLYGNKKPWEIFESNSLGDEYTNKNVRYFFTKLKKKKSDGTRFIRTVIGGGSWKGLDGEKSVYDGPKLVGSKKNYRYQYKGYQADDVVWTMREYSLDEKILKALRRRRLIHYEDVVLCCVKDKINVHARDHKELGDYTPSEHNNVFHELQQDQNSAQLVNQVQNIKDMMAPFVASYIEQGTANFQDSSPVYPFTSSYKHNNAFQELQQDQNCEQLIKQVQTVDEMVPSASHDSYPVYPFTSSEHYAFHELHQDQNSEQVNVIHQENHIEETVPFAQYHNDDVTSYSEEGATNFQEYNVDCYRGADFSSTLADLLNDIVTQPQLPIRIDESGYDYQLAQQMGSSSMVLNEGNIDAAAFVSDQWSTCCEEQVQNLEEAVPITFTEPTAPLVINNDECFPMEGLFDADDFIAADLSWASDLFD